MEPFSQCPQCGLVDECRAHCACGYGIEQAPAAPNKQQGVAKDDYCGQSPEPKSEYNTSRRARIDGLWFLLAGTVLSYLFIYEPLAAADNQERQIRVSMKGAVFCPLLFFFGVAHLILGKKAFDIFGPPKSPSLVGIITAVILGILGVGLYFVLETVLKAKGYQF